MHALVSAFKCVLCVSQCGTDTEGDFLFIYLRVVNKRPGQPLPEVTMDLHMQHAHLLALRPCITSTSSPWSLSDPPPTILTLSISVHSNPTCSTFLPQAMADFLCSLLWYSTECRQAISSSPPSPQRGGCAKVDRFNSCWVIQRKSFVKI